MFNSLVDHITYPQFCVFLIKEKRTTIFNYTTICLLPDFIAQCLGRVNVSSSQVYDLAKELLVILAMAVQAYVMDRAGLDS